MKAEWEAQFAPFLGERRLNLGCGATPEAGWTNLDLSGPAEITHDMRSRPWPLEGDYFDTVLASHVMEHFPGPEIVDIAWEVARVLKLGGHWIIVVPYGTSSGAWDNPLHLYRWGEMTPHMLSRRTYEEPGTAGTGAHQKHRFAQWQVVSMTFTPTPEWTGRLDDEIQAAMKRELNVIQEMQVVMRLEER